MSSPHPGTGRDHHPALSGGPSTGQALLDQGSTDAPTARVCRHRQHPELGLVLGDRELRVRTAAEHQGHRSKRCVLLVNRDEDLGVAGAVGHIGESCRVLLRCELLIEVCRDSQPAYRGKVVGTCRADRGLRHDG